MNSPEQNNTQKEPMKTAAEMQQEAQQAEVEAAVDTSEAKPELGQQSVEVAQLEIELAAAQAKADENWEQALRFKADMENQRRRSEKQIDDARKFSVQRFAEGLLPVIDSLEMGLQAEGGVEQIREGMNLTLKQFESVMEKFKLEAVGAVGDKFDPVLHQSIWDQSSSDHENNTVMVVMQKGYMLSGRSIRPALVGICKN